MRKYVKFGILLFLIFMSCRHQKGDSAGSIYKHFSNKVSLSVDSLRIEPVIKPGNIYLAGDYVVVSDVSGNADNHFAVFGDSMQYLYSFCVNGEGPEECLMPSVINNIKDSVISVRDHATDVCHKYLLTPRGAIHTETFNLPKRDPQEHYWEINDVSEGTMLAKAVCPRDVVRRLIGRNTGEIVQELPHSFDLKKKMGEDYYSEFEDFWMRACNNDFACAYYFVDCIEFGHINSNSLEIIHSTNTDLVPEMYPYTDEELSGKYKYNVDYNTVYYESLFMDEKKVYATYFGRPWGDISEHSTLMEIYSHEGEPLCLCQLPVPISSFIVRNDEVIAINLERNEDYFYIFKLDISQRSHDKVSEDSSHSPVG